jgi:hypothetical protein
VLRRSRATARAPVDVVGTSPTLRSTGSVVIAPMDAGVSPRQIDGGYEFNGWYLAGPFYRRVPNKSPWWVDDDEYIIASGPLGGYREVRRFAFRRWLAFCWCYNARTRNGVERIFFENLP